MFQTYYLFFSSLHVESIQQSAEDSKIPPQLFVPHTRLPKHSPSLSQSPSPNSQGYKAVQHAHVAVVVQSQTVPLETGVVLVAEAVLEDADVVVIGVVVEVDVAVVEIKDGSEIKQKSFIIDVSLNQIELNEIIKHPTILLEIISLILTYQFVDVPTGIQYMLQKHQNISEEELRFLKRSDLVGLCYHSTFQELDLMWNHRHELSESRN